tara:strand:+ start:1373 stop:2356 length:984 start_codon:yes stop_codon:yes gene_type:complete
MKTYNIAAPEGFHWMQYESGPVLMMGEYAPHEGAAETAAFEVVEEHDPERMPQAEPVPAPVQKRRLLFVVSQQSNLDRVRKTQLCGVEGRVFKEQYLEPLGITRTDVDVIDMGELAEHGSTQPLAVIALGKAARLALGNVADFSLPHPWSIRKSGDKRGELARKFKRIGRILETAHLTKTVTLKKADDAKRIVYGVVLDPYIVDAHDDYLSPAEIETTSHNFMASSRMIGLDHNGATEAQVVESWIQPYPDSDEYKKAVAGEPHRALRTPFGDDFVHSGSWVLGVKLSPENWAKVQAGELNAFSIGGFGTRENIEASEMPRVDFISG